MTDELSRPHEQDQLVRELGVEPRPAVYQTAVQKPLHHSRMVPAQRAFEARSSRRKWQQSRFTRPTQIIGLRNPTRTIIHDDSCRVKWIRAYDGDRTRYRLVGSQVSYH